MKKIYSLLLFTLMLFSYTHVAAQCVTGSAGGNANLSDDGGGSYSIACDGGSVDITATSPITAASNIQWTSGQTGDFVFTPDCTNLGCQEFTPCVPAGTDIPQQCLTFGALGVPPSGSGSNTYNLDFTISGLCYISGMTYSGDLGINLQGSGDVSLSVLQPDGVTQGPLTFDIDLINSLSPVPLSLLNLDVDPNGDWSIIITGVGLTGYTIDPNSEICLEPTTTAGVTCGDPVEVCVFGGCPTFISVQASEIEICSGGMFMLDATLDPLGAPNVDYTWSGTGIDASNQNSSCPMVTIENTTCAPITETYTVDIACTNDGSVVVTAAQVMVTVYPEIDETAVVIDNMTNVDDPNCSISVVAPCGFAVSGPMAFSPGDNGTTVDYVITNGNPACDVTVSSVVNCLGDCTPPDATVTTTCDGAGNYTVAVTVNSLGDSQSADIVLSDGTVQNVTAAGGPFSFGPYLSGNPVNIKILDNNDSSCSLNLGEYDGDCFMCPNLTTLDALATDVCSGTALSLVANVDMGTEGVDYAIQWFENGVAIGGGNTATYVHTATASDRCNVTTNTYTAMLTCLNGGAAATTTMLSVGSVNVYPTPEEGIDFVFENCSAMPIDNCGGLTIDLGGATDPAPGASTTVNYIISVAGAPAACQTTGTATVNCPNCSDYPGNGSATDNVLCWGESFDFSNTSALVASLGYEVGYVVTTDPPSSYGSTSALLAADISGGPQGAFAAPGSIAPDNYVNDGSLINPTDPCGEVLYFTPFLSFACQSYIAENSSGTIFTTNPDGLQVPGVGGVTLAVPQVPFCTGLVTYDIEVCAEDGNTDGEEPLAEDAFFGIIDGLPGGIFSNFPNINDIHDSCNGFLGCDPNCENQNGWTVNPSGELINITTVNLVTLPFTSDTDELYWDFRVDVICDSEFPTICPDCDAVGAPVAVRFLPNTTLDAIVAPANICAGESIDLTALNPAASNAATGSYTWSEAGANIANPTAVVPPVGTTEYCVSFAFCETGDCETETCVSVTVDPLPVLTAPVIGPICQGESVDLTAVEGDVTADAGAISWYIGGSNLNGGAAIADPTAVIPVGSEQYCAVFTDAATGCSNSICASVTYTPLPVLLSAAPTICEGGTLELTDSNTDITTDAGVFVWYDADPATGSAPLASTAIVNPVDGTEYWVTFTDDATGCSATTSIIVTVLPAPVLTAPMAELCEGEALDLVALEGQVTADAGTFTWYDNDPAIGTLIAMPMMVMPVAGDMYCVEFVADADGCADFVCFTPTINLPPIFTDYAPPAECADSGPFDLTAYEASLSAGNMFTWYNADPVTGAMPIADATMAAAANGATTTFYFVLADPITGCTDTSFLDLQVYDPITGATAMYDCDADMLVVDFTGATGGLGPYIVDGTSPNQDGDVLLEGDEWMIIVADGNGCLQDTITGTRTCEACEAMAGEPTSAGEDICSTDLPVTAFDFTGSFAAETADPNMATPTVAYLLVTGMDTLLDSNNTGIFDLSTGLQEVGDTACAYKVIYDQDELDAFLISANAELTAQIGFELFQPGSDLPTVFNLLNGLAGPFSLQDILAFVVTPGVVNLPNPLSPGTFIDITIPSLCIDVTTASYCVNVIECVVCTAMAGEPTSAGEDICSTDLPVTAFDFTGSFAAETADPNMATPTVAYLLVTGMDTLLDSNNTGIFDLSTGLQEVGDTACAYKVIYDQDELDAFLISANAELTAQIGFELFQPGSDLPTVFNLLNGLAGPFSLQDILAFVVTPGVVNLPNPLSPGTFIDITIPELCIDVTTASYCVNVIECGNCPLATNIIAPDACSGEMVDVCVDFDMMVDATVSVTVDGTTVDGSAGGMQICVPVTAPMNTTCDAAPYDYNITADCNGTAIDVGVILSAQIYPEYVVTIVGPSCDGVTTGSATLEVMGGVAACQVINGVAGSANTCPDLNDTDASLTYDFTADLAGVPASCITGDIMGSISTDCITPCDCPADPDVQVDVTELCGSGVATLTASFLGGTGTGTLTIAETTGTITGITSGTAITLPTNISCAPVIYTFDVTAVCSDGSPIPAGVGNAQVTVTVYPSDPVPMLVVPSSDVCSGAIGVGTFTLMAADGVTPCDGPTTLDAPTNTTCIAAPTTLDATYTQAELATLLGGDCYSDISASELILVYPDYTITIVPPACDGVTTGSATLEVMGGVAACQVINGVAGSANTCPDLNDTDASLTYDFTADLAGVPASCITGDIMGGISTDCMTPCDCPADPEVQVDVTEVCENGMATLTASFLGGAGTGTLTIAETTGTITGITSGTPFVLPLNNSCAPVAYTFDVTAVCSDGSPIPAGVGNAQVTVTVYPSLTATDVSAMGCGTLRVDLLAADGTSCESQTQVCMNDGETLTADFSGTVVDPLGCSTLTAITGACSDCICEGEITGMVIGDIECDGIDGEPLAGVTIELQDGVCISGVDCPTVMTDATGTYTFAPVTCGTYTVAIDETTLPCMQEGTANSPRAGVTVTMNEEIRIENFVYGVCTDPIFVECVSIARVCDGNALYATLDQVNDIPTPLAPASDWTFEWYLDGNLVATVIGLPYYSPNTIGDYTVVVTDPTNCLFWENVAPCESPFPVNDIIDCQDCGK